MLSTCARATASWPSASGTEKLNAAWAHRADNAIDYTIEGRRDRVRELTDQHGADVNFAPVDGDAFTQALRCDGWEDRADALAAAHLADSQIHNTQFSAKLAYLHNSRNADIVAVC